MHTPKITPPDHLGPDGRKFWQEITAEYALEAHDLARLAIACDCLDRIAQCRAVLASKIDRVAMSAWRDAAKIFLATVKHLGVDKADQPSPPRSSKR